MKTKMKRVIHIATSLDQALRELDVKTELSADLISAIRELDIEIDYYLTLIRSITRNIKEIKEI